MVFGIENGEERCREASEADEECRQVSAALFKCPLGEIEYGMFLGAFLM